MSSRLSQFETVSSYLLENSDQALETLKQLLRIPSVSADSQFRKDVLAAAEFVRAQLEDAGLETEIYPTDGYPVVYGSWTKLENAPTVLIYGHYDVQPADPYDLWETPPFEPDVRDGHIYARGATDDKGQMLTHVNSVQAWLKAVGNLPVNVKFVIEGEEEVGSKALAEFLDGKYDDQLGVSATEKLSCDVIAISDNSQFAPGRPAITYGLRGIVALELNLEGPSQDLHSGFFGGAVTNPINALTSIAGSMKSPDGKILVDGFFDGIIDIDSVERENWNKLGFNDQDLMDQIDVEGLSGEEGYTTLERQWARPTLDFNGIYGGYQGEGSKTIIPSSAGLKITCRLAPGQDPDHVIAMIRDHIARQIPPGIRWKLSEGHGAPAMAASTDNPFMKAASDAIESAYGVQPVLIRSGGSIPIVSSFKQKLKVDTLLLGWGQSDDNLHSPNEKFAEEDFHKGTLASAYFWGQFQK